jgi:hypothetical protein
MGLFASPQKAERTASPTLDRRRLPLMKFNTGHTLGASAIPGRAPRRCFRVSATADA